MAATYGYKDMRTSAELLLSPYQPAARFSIGTGSLRLDFGGKVSIPGVLTKANQLSGALRSIFGAAITIKQTATMIDGLVHQTIADFDRLNRVGSQGIPAIGASIARSIPLPFPNAQAFFQFSALKPGQTLPAQYQSILKVRRRQLQALGAQLSKVKSMTNFGGVIVTENYQRSTYPLPDQVDKPTVSKLAVGGSIAQQDPVMKDKAKFLVTGVPIAAGKPSFWSRFTSLAQIKAAPGFNPTLGQFFKDRKSAASWSEPPSPANPQFPYNQVQQSSSGHVIEIDDTPTAERIHIFHRSGSFIEWFPDGTVKYKNMKDGYFITMNNQFINVSGNCHINVDGNATIHAKKEIKIESEEDINFVTKKDFNVYADGSVNLRAKKTFSADGLQINLRYINLPLGIHPVLGALVPRVNLAALKADFPRSNIDAVMKEISSGPLDYRTVNNLLKLNQAAIPVPLENPLSNPGVYAKQTPSAVSYRARLFDTPEETQNFELYTAHMDTQRALGDIPAGVDARSLGGELVSHDATLPASSPDVNYLDFEPYKGNFTYPADTKLGASSFALRDLVDTALFPDVVAPIKAPVVVVQGNTGTTATGDVDAVDPNTSSTNASGKSSRESV